MEKIQGAEAEVILKEDSILKKRLRKKYRHSELDNRLVEERNRRESKILKQASRAGANVPGLIETSEREMIQERIKGHPLKQILEENSQIMKEAGRNVALLHEGDIVHGDLTSSNLLWTGNELYIIDFGLAERTGRVEDKAVDLHLLKEMLESYHSNVSTEAWKSFSEGYLKEGGAEKVLDKLDEIKNRKRYR